MLPWSVIFSDRVSTTLETIESWISSLFVRADRRRDMQLAFYSVFLLFLMIVGPWFIFLAYDIALYLVRIITYEVPVVGGRARGKERPRAPSLKERPGGDPRVLGIGVPGATYVDDEDLEEEETLMKERETSEDDEDADEDAGGNVGADVAQNKTDDVGISRDENDDEPDPRSERIFSIGGADEREGWTEVNARRRMGFKDDEGPS